MSRKMEEKLSGAFETYDVCKLNNVEHMQSGRRTCDTTCKSPVSEILSKQK